MASLCLVESSAIFQKYGISVSRREFGHFSEICHLCVSSRVRHFSEILHLYVPCLARQGPLRSVGWLMHLRLMVNHDLHKTIIIVIVSSTYFLYVFNHYVLLPLWSFGIFLSLERYPRDQGGISKGFLKKKYSSRLFTGR